MVSVAALHVPPFVACPACAGAERASGRRLLSLPGPHGGIQRGAIPARPLARARIERCVVGDGWRRAIVGGTQGTFSIERALGGPCRRGNQTAIESRMP